MSGKGQPVVLDGLAVEEPVVDGPLGEDEPDGDPDAGERVCSKTE